MLFVGTAGSVAVLNPGRLGIPSRWRDGESVDVTVNTNFPDAPSQGRQFSSLLTLLDLKRLRGFRIRSTDNLLDHLSIQKHAEGFKSIISIYYHAMVLKELSKYINT
jgi:hypothetical protein